MMYASLMDLFSERVGELRGTLELVAAMLPNVSGGIRSEDLRNRIEQRIESIQVDMRGLEEMCGTAPEMKKVVHGPVIRVLIAEIKRIGSAEGNPEVRDAAFLGVVERIELSIVALCRQGVRYAARLGYGDCKKKLQGIQRDAERSNKSLERVADGFIFAPGVEQRALQGAHK